MSPPFLTKITARSALVGIVGMGYVGLPLAKAFIANGFRVVGFDVDQAKIDRLLAGESYIGHIPADWIAQCVGEKTLQPTADMARLGEPDAILICVPTP